MDNRPSIRQLRELLKLKNYKAVINDDGSVAVPSSQVFMDLSNAMDSTERLKPKNIYTIFKFNRHNMHTDILEFYNIVYEPPIEYDPNSDDSDNEDHNIHFTVDIRPIWNDVQTEEVMYNFKNRCRAVGTLKRQSWTNFLFEEIFKLTKIQCPLTFKRSKTSGSGFAITVYGYCSECGCKFNGKVANEPTNDGDPICMECSVVNYDSSFRHNKKRQLKGSRRIQVATEMVENKTLPVIWRRKEMDRLTDVGDPEPPHLFRLNTLRKAKQERHHNLMGIKDNIYQSLHLLKYSPQTQGAIRNIALDPFCVHYWTDEQIAVYEKYHQVLYIDATGSLMRSVPLPNGELSSHIYLYQAVAKIEEKTGPVFQMISSIQNTNFITTWLMEFLRIGSTHKTNFPFPNEVITDFDRALMGAVVRPFAKQYSLADYLTVCFNLINNGQVQVPSCFVRLDICHFMNMVAKWKFWREYPSRVKLFYVNCIAVLRNQTALAGIENHAEAIFTTALNSNLSPGNSTDSARHFLTMAIRGVKVAEEHLESNEHGQESGGNSDKRDSEIDDQINDKELLNTNIVTWATGLYKTCENEIALEEETSNVNGFYCPKVAKKLRVLLSYFPLFSEVMPPIFGYGSERPTSAPVESEFNDLKHRVLRDDKRPMRADYFVSRHLSSFSSKLKLAVASGKSHDIVHELNNANDAQLNFVKKDYNNEYSIPEKGSVSVEENCHLSHIFMKTESDTDKRKKAECEPNLPTINKPIQTVDNFDLSLVTTTDDSSNVREEFNDGRLSEELLATRSEIDSRKVDKLCISDKENYDPNFSTTTDINKSKRKKMDEAEFFNDLTELKSELNWRNKNRRRSSHRYGDPYPQFDLTLPGKLMLPIIINGNSCSNVHHAEKILVVKNTCPFDSACQIIATSIRNNALYEQAIAEVDNAIYACARTVIDHGCKVKFNRERAQFLSQVKLFAIDLSASIINVNAATNISNLMRELLAETPSCITTYRCEKCNAEDRTTSAVIDVNHDILRKQGFSNLAAAIEGGFFIPTTPCCNQIKSVIRKYGPMLMVDTDRGDRKLTKLKDIPLEVNVLEASSLRKYGLAGIIAYHGTFRIGSIGHYTAFIKMYEKWVQFDGDSKAGKSLAVNDNTKIHAHMCVYTCV